MKRKYSTAGVNVLELRSRASFLIGSVIKDNGNDCVVDDPTDILTNKQNNTEDWSEDY